MNRTRTIFTISGNEVKFSLSEAKGHTVKKATKKEAENKQPRVAQG